MNGFDLRLVIPILINLLKYQSEALPGDWDAFNLVLNPHHSSWANICFQAFLFLLFSFTSITFTLPRLPPDTTTIHFQFENFSPHMALSLVCSIISPQALFWFLYPAILILNHFLVRINVNLSALPVWNLHISSSVTRQEQPNRVTTIASPEDQSDFLEEA